MYKFCMSIGDWSGDGHGRYEDFLVESNAPVEQVREAHFLIKEITGIDIEEVCSNYDEDEIGEYDMDRLKGLGYKFKNYTGMGENIISAHEMECIWLFLLQKVDPSLHLELANENIPTLHFYGCDKKGRHIGFVGYGLFA